MRTRVLAVVLVLVHVFLEMHDLVEYQATNGAVVGLAFIQRSVHLNVTRQGRVAEESLAAIVACQWLRVLAPMDGHVLLQKSQSGGDQIRSIWELLLTNNLSSVENAL